MSVRALIFVQRRPDLTAEQFQSHYEKKHLPLLRSITGADFCVFHRRSYLGNAFLRPTTGGDMYDAVAELEWRDEAHMKRFVGLTQSHKAASALRADEAEFVAEDTMKIVFVRERQVTERCEVSSPSELRTAQA